MVDRELLRNEFINSINCRDYNITKLPSDASSRVYYRLTKDDKSYILMDAPPEKEKVGAFVEICDFLNNNNLKAPQIINKDLQNGFLILEDFGDTTFKNIIAKPKEHEEFPEEIFMYERAIDALIHLQKNCTQPDLESYNTEKLLAESNLFIKWYAEIFSSEPITQKQTEEFNSILTDLFSLLDKHPKKIILRDYHAENIFWLPEEIGLKKIGLIDFQDAIYGPSTYDIVSLLEDARKDVSDEIVNLCINRYLRAFPEYLRKDFMVSYRILSIQRNLKIIGIFSRQAIEYKNSKYLPYLNRVWGYIYKSLEYPTLLPFKNWFEVALKEQVMNRNVSEKKNKLMV